jgi:Zn-dependent peptidase ImmA (M78 family)/transcriptional regulator with XRE-family HTH domain
MFAERLQRARKASGLSMKALGKQIGLSANAVKKYEHGDTMPTSANLIKIAKALDVRAEYFFRPTQVSLGNVEYRKRASTSKALVAKITEHVLEQAERWTELLDFYSDAIKPIPSFSLPLSLPQKVSSYEEVELLAGAIRTEWKLGANPIPDMIDTLESHGVMVISTGLEGSEKFDGLAGEVSGIPMVVVSANKPGDRQRFTLAHELGHLVINGRAPDLDEEKACNRFAGAFLLPKESLVGQIGESRHALEAQELYLLKHEFGISMMAILMRLADCQVITANQKKNYYIAWSKWRKTEPGEQYPAENTFLFKQLVYRALGEEYIGESKAAELLQMSLSSFHRERQFELVDEAVN